MTNFEFNPKSLCGEFTAIPILVRGETNFAVRVLLTALTHLFVVMTNFEFNPKSLCDEFTAIPILVRGGTNFAIRVLLTAVTRGPVTSIHCLASAIVLLGPHRRSPGVSLTRQNAAVGACTLAMTEFTPVVT
ncbi:hypothetical protein Acr_19g0007810 [Actinidia rufa]|uniref:Uncharacterized protein n=1 Tax=Actinidia rufa TaxID=165716 RepID=A0A7J0GAM2_9ERIC|nr:hypothetical protein Acr_19g0007810 [Actinidia rufa]